MLDTSTQAHLPIENIRDGMLTLRDGSAALILQTSAVNFDLLSEKEQLAIISAFAAFLNSLSFPIQIIIRSKRLDISNYLAVLNEARRRQTNPQLQAMMSRYQVFMNTIIRENEVLDKQFYIAIPVSYLELGLVASADQRFQKTMTILTARRDHIVRQLARIGLKTTQLDSEKLVRLFYDLYNEGPAESIIPAQTSQPLPAPPQPSATPPLVVNPPPPPAPPSPTNIPVSQPRAIHPATPFVIEELPDDYGAI